jgi:putative phosphoribosyl transferase
MAPGSPFRDRSDAGRALASELLGTAGTSGSAAGTVVLGLARGGVPVAAEVARALGAGLDVMVVRKIGHPRHPEYALGAVTEDGAVSGEDLPEAAASEQIAAARAQAAALRGSRPRVALDGRAVIVVDDGLATGRSMAAALESVRAAGAATLTMAVPVTAQRGFDELARAFGCDARAVIVESATGPFAVGSYYEDFTQVTDLEVRDLLGAGVTCSGRGRTT